MERIQERRPKRLWRLESKWQHDVDIRDGVVVVQVGKWMKSVKRGPKMDRNIQENMDEVSVQDRMTGNWSLLKS